MISAISLLGVVAGASLAYLAERYPRYVVALETSGGAMLIGGLMLLGVAMPILP